MEIRWKVIIPVLLIAAVAALQIAPSVVGFLAQGLAERLNRTEWDRMIKALIDWISSALGPDSFSDLLAEIGKAGPAGILALVAIVIVAAYLVLRPLSPAFRVKRVLFNLAPSAHVDVAHTTTTWNAARSSGIYALEHALFGRLGVRSPNEIDFDLWLSAAATSGLTWLALAFFVEDMREYPEGLGIDLACIGIVVCLAVARTLWLLGTARSRRRPSEDVTVPAGFLALKAERIVETRSVIETASLGVLFQALTFFTYVASPVWIRLVRERRDLERAAQRAWGTAGRLPSNRVWPALGSAVLFFLIPAVPVAIYLTKLKRLQAPGVGSAGRTRAWLVPLLVAASLSLWFDLIYLFNQEDSSWAEITLLPLFIVVPAVAFGAIQHEQNALVRHVSTPLPHDDPLLKPDQTTQPERVSARVPAPDPTQRHLGTLQNEPQSSREGSARSSTARRL